MQNTRTLGDVSRKCRYHTWLGLLALGLVAVACGGATDDAANNGGAGSGDGGDLFGGDGGKGDGTGVGNVGAVTPGSACATSNAGTTRPPAYLVFMYDRSKSMDDAVGSTTKWAACKAGLSNFYASASSAGIHASLTFFGVDMNESTADCSASSYVTPQVPMAPLPNASTYSGALNKTGPSTDTPTLAALKGAIQYAQGVKAGLKGNEKVAVVLVTDGDPHGCTGNSVQAVHDAAAAVAAQIPTYVVGIGSSLTNLKSMAAGGGTQAILVNTTSPQQVTADLEKALGSIANAQLGCEYGLPKPPTGQTLDVNAVNVDYTPSGAAQTTLTYSADCADANGWHYDNLTSPTHILMCPSICSRLKADKGGKVDIIFGCNTAVPPGAKPPSPK